MRVSRRFLRTAALAAALALGLAGTALAANRMWTGGGGDKKWSTLANWDSGIPGTGDKAIITAGAEVEVDGAAAAQVVDLAEGAKLTLNAKLELDNGGALEASGSATVTSKAAGGLTFDTTNKVAVSAGKTLTLAAEGAGTIVGAGDDLELSGGGTLTLKTPVRVVDDLVITDGSTLVVDVDDALPELDGSRTTLVEIPKGNLVVNAGDFGNAVQVLLLDNGNLTLKKKMVDGLKTVRIQSGDLVVAEGATIGDGTDGELELGKAADKVGHLKLNGDMTLAKLKTEDTANTITVASGKTLIDRKSTRLNSSLLR